MKILNKVTINILPLHHAVLWSYAVLAEISLRYPPV